MHDDNYDIKKRQVEVCKEMVELQNDINDCSVLNKLTL